jgi:hypothetical protein
MQLLFHGFRDEVSDPARLVDHLGPLSDLGPVPVANTRSTTYEEPTEAAWWTFIDNQPALRLIASARLHYRLAALV